MLDEVAFLFLGRALTGLHADNAFAATALRTKRAHGCSFDKPPVRDADNAALVRNEVFHIDLGLIRNDFRQPRRTILVADFAQFLFDDREDALLFGEDVAQVFNGLDELLVFLVDLLSLVTGKFIKPAIENLVGLLLAERITAIRQARGISN